MDMTEKTEEIAEKTEEKMAKEDFLMLQNLELKLQLHQHQSKEFQQACNAEAQAILTKYKVGPADRIDPQTYVITRVPQEETKAE